MSQVPGPPQPPSAFALPLAGLAPKGRKSRKLKCFYTMPFLGTCLKNQSWSVVSTHPNNIRQNGNLPQIGVKIKNS